MRTKFELVSFYSHLYIDVAVAVSFTGTSFNVTEPGTVGVGVQLTGNLSIVVDVMVEVNFTTASGISLLLCTLSFFIN